MSERHEADPGDAGAAADHRRVGRGVVRGLERRHGDEPPAVEAAGHRVDRGDLQRGLLVERRQQPRQSFREHRLPDPGRAGHREVVASGRGELEGGTGRVLAADVGEVGHCRRPATAARRRRRCRRARRRGRRRRGRAPPRRRGCARRPPRGRGRARPPARWPAARRSAGHRPQRAASAATSAPRTARTRPSSPSSPTTTSSATASRGTCPVAASRARAIARSSVGPRLGSSAGESPTVFFGRGHSRRLLSTADRHRSRASPTQLVGHPDDAEAD